jgi:hypothetical protein
MRWLQGDLATVVFDQNTDTSAIAFTPARHRADACPPPQNRAVRHS